VAVLVTSFICTLRLETGPNATKLDPGGLSRDTKPTNGAPDRTDKSDGEWLIQAFVSSVGHYLARFQERGLPTLWLTIGAKYSRTATSPADKTDRTPFVSSVRSLLAHCRELLARTAQTLVKAPGRVEFA